MPLFLTLFNFLVDKKTKYWSVKVRTDRMSHFDSWRCYMLLIFTQQETASLTGMVFRVLLQNEISLESFIVIFNSSSPKGFYWQNMKKSENSCSSTSSRYLQSTALKFSILTLWCLPFITFPCCLYLHQILDTADWEQPTSFATLCVGTMFPFNYLYK